MITFPIQRCLLPDADAPGDLYFRHHGHLPAYCSGPGELTIPAGCRLTSDTYFNAVFATHWRENTGIERLRFRAAVAGRCRVRVLRASPTQRAELARCEVSAAEEAIDLAVPIDAAAGPEPGIVFFEVQAFAPVTLREAVWSAEVAAVHPVRLAVGSCTFRREDYLVRNLKTLVADREVMAGVAAILIADNGSSPRLHAELAGLSPRIRLYPQANIGGAGGFARVLLEVQGVAEATHVLLMDDDVRLDSEALFRARAFLMAVQENVCVGGQMLDLLRPGLLVEAGARADFARLAIEPQWAGLQLGDPRSLQALARPYEIDYNAWWFCVLPLDAVRAGGLPLPVFVRGDDIEYGCRLKRAGIRTLVPPGIAIWHEPFDAKTGGWQSYFATRNFLIAAACQGEGWAKTAGKAIRRRVVSSLLASDYYEAWLICEGLADFLAGPTILEGDPSSLLARLQSGRIPRRASRPSQRLRPLPLRHRYLFSRRLRRLERRWQMVRHWLMPASAKVHVEGFVAAGHRAWWNLACHDRFLLEQPFGTDLEERRRNPRAFRREIGRVRRLQRRLSGEEARLTTAWRESFPDLVSAPSWRRRLGLADTEGGEGTLQAFGRLVSSAPVKPSESRHQAGAV
jgi:galactofuranosylgalactofuranosylrhamnosyl-N-acetylglucosaminyl-diphospho-decaprenol beta-1,5/1,6-galactofuranosyltransferase